MAHGISVRVTPTGGHWQSRSAVTGSVEAVFEYSIATAESLNN